MRDDNLDHSPEHDLLSHDDKTKLPTEMKAILLIPPRLPRFVRLPVMASEMGWQAPALNLTGSNRASAATGGRGSDSATSIRFVLIEDVLMMFLDVFFPDFTVKERGMFRILRDSEVEVDEEAVDLVRMFEKALKRRRKGLVVDLTVDSSMPQSLIGFMSEKLGVNRDADAGVAHRDAQGVAADLGGQLDLAGLGELDRVAHEVECVLLGPGAAVLLRHLVLRGVVVKRDLIPRRDRSDRDQFKPNQGSVGLTRVIEKDPRVIIRRCVRSGRLGHLDVKVLTNLHGVS
jgi:hypothetical protein